MTRDDGMRIVRTARDTERLVLSPFDTDKAPPSSASKVVVRIIDVYNKHAKAYPAVLTYRDLTVGPHESGAYIDGEEVMVEDVNERGLAKGQRYSGYVWGIKDWEDGSTSTSTDSVDRQSIYVIIDDDTDPIVRIISVDVGTGQYVWRYTVRQVEIRNPDALSEGLVAVDFDGPGPIEWTNVVELEDNLLPISQHPDPKEGIYRLGTTPEGQKYLANCCVPQGRASSSSSSSSSSSQSVSGSFSSSESSSTSDNQGSCVVVVDDVQCLAEGLLVEKKTLCGTVKIGGVVYPINLTLS